MNFQNLEYFLTTAEEVSITRAAERLHLSQQVIGDINGNRRGELRIGVSHTRGQAILPLLLPDFRRAYPLADLSVVEGSTKELEADLERGVIDVLIGFAPFLLESAETMELSREHLHLIAPRCLLDEAFGDRADEVRALSLIHI